jgi:putative heme-binding domain-containing protein
LCLDESAALQERVEALELLAGLGGTESLKILGEVACRRNGPPELRVSAIGALADSGEADSSVWRALLDGLALESPSVRGAILDACLARSELARLLLDKLESGSLSRGELGRARIDRLVRHGDPAVRGRGEKVLAATPLADRSAVLHDYGVALTMNSDPRRGEAVFARHCANCHRIGGIGTDVGPDISDSRARTPEQLLTDILDPNRAVDGPYIGYSIATTDGRVLAGVISTETSTHLTVRQAEGREATVARSELESIRSSGVSMMPEGFEKDISLDQMGDLVSFIKNWRYLRGAEGGP